MNIDVEISCNDNSSIIEKMSSNDIFFVCNIICQTSTESAGELKRGTNLYLFPQSIYKFSLKNDLITVF